MKTENTSISQITLKDNGIFVVDFHKPVRPTKNFTSEEKAIAWVQSI